MIRYLFITNFYSVSLKPPNVGQSAFVLLLIHHQFDFGDDEDDTFEVNDEESEDEGEIVYSTIKNENQDDDETTEVQKPIDPRWEALMKLNKN